MLEKTYFKIWEYCPNIFLESHVDHPISLVQNQISTDVEHDDPLVQHVHQATGSRHSYVHSSVGYIMKTKSLIFFTSSFHASCE